MHIHVAGPKPHTAGLALATILAFSAGGLAVPLPAAAAEAIIVSTAATCDQFLAAIGASGSATGTTCLVSAPLGDDGPVLPAGQTATIAPDWTLELVHPDEVGGLVVAGTLNVQGTLVAHAGWRSDAPELLVTGRLRNSGIVTFDESSLDFVATHLVNRGSVVNLGTIRGGLVNSGTVTNLASGVMRVGEGRFLLDNTGRIVNDGSLVISAWRVDLGTNAGVIVNSRHARMTIDPETWLLTQGRIVNRGHLISKGTIALGCGGRVTGKVSGQKPIDTCVRVTVPRVNVASRRPELVRVSWRAGKASSVDVEYREVPLTGPPAPFARWITGTTARSSTFTGTPGQTYEFRARANAGDRPWPWSATAATTLPMDERGVGQFSEGWTDKASAKAYAGTYRVATGSGRTWSVTDFSGSVQIYGTTHKKGSKARIYVDGTYRRTISTYARHTHYRRVLYSISMDWGEHTITVVSKTSGTHNKLIVDAYAVLR